MSTPAVLQAIPLLVETWVKKYDTLIQAAEKLKGGWEGWAQIELALFLEDEIKKTVPGVRVLREQNVFQTSSQAAADIVVFDLGTRNEYHVLELKCRLLNESAYDTMSRVNQDADKMATKGFKATFMTGNTACALNSKTLIGISTDPQCPQIAATLGTGHKLNCVDAVKGTPADAIYVVHGEPAQLMTFDTSSTAKKTKV